MSVSAATVWEISIKQSFGKLEVPSDLPGQLDLNRFQPLSITISHANAAGALPRHHDDPFDRMLVAQAIEEGLVLLTGRPKDKPLNDVEIFGLSDKQVRGAE